MLNSKALLVGCVLGVLSTLVGMGLAKADCLEGQSYDAAAMAVLDCDGPGEVIALADGSFEAQCDREAFPVETFACDVWAVEDSGLDCTGMSADVCDNTVAHLYELCMVVAINTPGAVR